MDYPESHCPQDVQQRGRRRNGVMRGSSPLRYNKEHFNLKRNKTSALLSVHKNNSRSRHSNAELSMKKKTPTTCGSVNLVSTRISCPCLVREAPPLFKIRSRSAQGRSWLAGAEANVLRAGALRRVTNRISPPRSRAGRRKLRSWATRVTALGGASYGAGRRE